MRSRREPSPTTSSPNRRPDFGARAARYDELRPVDDNWWELFETLVRVGDLRGHRVLEVGCGTGTFAVALAERARVWAVDAAPEMIEVARRRDVERRVGWRIADAHALPFREGWFDRVVMRLVVHLVDRAHAFGEARRVLRPDGRLVIATFDPSHFDRYWLNHLFPSLEKIDRERFPTQPQLERELLESGFREVESVRLSQSAETSRETALEKIRGRHISTFDLIDEAEYGAGLERAAHELPERVPISVEWVIAVATL